MGCCNSRKETELKIEEKFIQPFEETLSLHKFNFLQLDPYFSKNNQKGFLTFFELSKSFEALSLPCQEIFEFYDQFDRSRSRIVTEKRFSLLQLQTLFLLFCQGDIKSKLKYWCSLYDDGKNSIVRSRVEEMLENLFKVLVDYISGYVVKKNSDSNLANYQKSLISGKDKIIEEMSQKIRSNKNIVTIDEFQLNCLKYYGKNILCSVYLRDQIYSLDRNSIKKPRMNDDLIEVKKTPLVLSFDDLSDISMSFDKESAKINHKKTISNVSLFSNDSATNKKQNFRYQVEGERRFSILEPLKVKDSGDGENNPGDLEINDKKLKAQKNKNGLLPGAKLKKEQRRGSYNYNSPIMEQATLNVNHPTMRKRFSIVVTSTEL